MRQQHGSAGLVADSSLPPHSPLFMFIPLILLGVYMAYKNYA